METLSLNTSSDFTSMFEGFPYSDGAIQVRVRPAMIPAVKSSDVIVLRSYNSSIMGPQFASFGATSLVYVTSALRGINPTADYILELPYLLGARADRRFVEGDCFGLDVALKLIECAGPWAEIRVLDVHNPTVLPGHFKNVLPKKTVLSAIKQFGGDDPLTILFPDKGAADRYCSMLSYSEMLSKGTMAYLLYATKKRDPETGKFLEFVAPSAEELRTEKILIVDDICDAGGTFLGIAKNLPAGKKLGLYVTHGIFSKGFSELGKVFSEIYTTDSAVAKSILELAAKKHGSSITVYNAFEELHINGGFNS